LKENTMSTPRLTLDPKTTALVLIDLQHGIVAMDVHPQPSSAVVAQSKQLADAFRIAQAPVVWVTVGTLGAHDGVASAAAKPANWSTVVDAAGAQASDLYITKRQWGAFYGTELDLQLRRRGIRTIVLAGISTNVGVESTARDAYERGYHQVFVADAMASPSAEAHANTLKFTFPRIGLTRSTAEVLAAIASH
jgi:nicotinamidase-related amidase